MKKKILKYFVGRVYKPILAKYLSGTRSYRYKGISLVIPPQVFHPAFFFSTKLLLKHLDKGPLQGKSFLELGAGSGLIAFYAAKKGASVTATDINPVAVEYLQKNRQRNDNLPVEIILSDLFTAIPRKQFDIIAINPPYFRKNPKLPADYAWYCGEQGEYFDKLFKTIGAYLHPQSSVLIILSEVCDLEMIHQFARKHGWSLEIVLTHQNWLEKMLLYELASSPKKIIIPFSIMSRMPENKKSLKKKVSSFLQTWPAFLFLLPLFFVMHGYIVNYNAVPAGEAAVLILIYTATALLIAAIAWLFFRNILKAGLFALSIMCLHFFYGSLQDMIQNNFPHSFVLRYRFIFPFIFFFFLAIIIWLKKRNRPLQKLALYLNSVLLILLIIDLGSLFVKMIGFEKNKTPQTNLPGMAVCDTCAKPDIFFIIPDQYTGNIALKGIFNFDNTPFIHALENRGFHVAASSSSNYNLTPFSVASTLNLDYISLKQGAQDYGSVSYSYNLIRNNRVLQYLDASGYRFFNCSIFDFEEQPANEYGAFLPYGIKLITSQTFIARLEKDFQSDILAGKFGKALQKKYAYEYMHFNDDILALTRSIASKKVPAPKFVYTHLMMPHYPYYFDSSAQALPLKKLAGLRKANFRDYSGYLQYTNKKILGLVDHILATNGRPAVIILLGDHGFRHPDMKTDRRYDFMNLNAVYLPNRNYAGLYDSITNVNLFRAVFNNLFHVQLPLLKDSTIDVWPDNP